MSAGWVAGSVRARLLLERRLGAEGARAVASCGSLEAALARARRHGLRACRRGASGLEDAQRAVAAQTLLELRILAGWLPRGAAEGSARSRAWFELVNVENRLVYLRGGRLRPAVRARRACRRVAAGGARAEPRRAARGLRNSVWGDPGGEEPEEIQLVPPARLGAAGARAAPEAEHWALGARRCCCRGRGRCSSAARRRPAGARPRSGPVGARASSLDDVARRAPAGVAWPLAGVEWSDELWRAEAALVAGGRARGRAAGARPARGARCRRRRGALLGLDAVRVAAALGVAARGGGGAGAGGVRCASLTSSCPSV